VNLGLLMERVVVSWPQPVLSTHRAACSPALPSRMRERIRATEVRRHAGQDKDSLVSEGERGVAGNVLLQRQSLTASHKETGAQPVSRQWPPWQTSSHMHALFPLPQSVLLSMTFCGMK